MVRGPDRMPEMANALEVFSSLTALSTSAAVLRKFTMAVKCDCQHVSGGLRLRGAH